MTRKTISDIIITKKSIRQIPILAERKPTVVRVNPNWQRKSLNPKFVIWLIAVICLLALFFGISIIFSSATVIVTPRIEKITFADDVYPAKLNSTGVTGLSYEFLKVKQTAGETIEATEDKEVSQKATGKIIIYNGYSTAPQRLINNTRFEANNGKVYRINSSVIVPGYKKAEGNIIPGSIEATVFADQAGDSYNLRLADLAGDFRIPGFKGDPRYQSFYARLKTDIAGGLIGKQRVVAADLRKATEDIIKTKLKEQLLKEFYAVKPENYIIFKDGYSIDFTNLADTAVGSDKVKLNIEGELNGVVFNNLKLAKYISTEKIKNFDGLPVELVPGDNLLVTFITKDNTSLWKNSALDIKFNGEAGIRWQYDAENIKKDLAGKSGSDVKNLVAKYKDSLVGIKVIFRPVWTRYFPDNLNKIKITEQI